MNILFVCSKNKWRSLTAETIFKNNSKHEVKSAGTEAGARIKVTAGLLKWAELVFVMEKSHKKRITQKFGDIILEKKIIILDIPDDYKYMDPELIEILKSSVSHYISGQ